jgi:hypothetical protein
MLVNGKFVKDWDKERIGIAYHPVWYRHASMCYDMHRLQDHLIDGGPLLPSVFDKLKSLIFPYHGQ